MISYLLNTTADIIKPTASFDGLGWDVSKENISDTLPCRIRQLSAKEQYQIQGSTEVANYRVYAEGSLSDYPNLTLERFLVIDGNRYRVVSLNQGQDMGPVLMQIDCTHITGV